MDIKHDLLPKQKRRKHGLKVTIDLFPLATELYGELEKLGLIDRLKEVKQLGRINISKNLTKSRYDYVILQLYFHQIIRKKIQNELRFSYNNRLRVTDLLKGYELCNDDLTDESPVTLADVMQILVIAYNIGHFYNTFVASKAIVMLSMNEHSFREHIIKASADDRFQMVAEKVLDSHNYQRVHLLNSLLILEKCDQSKRAVRVAKELIISYLIENELPSNSKLHWHFNTFRKVRTASFVSYDLQVATVPFTIDLWNTEGIEYFFREYLAEYNNNTSSTALISEMAGMLNASVYNELESSICFTQISKRMIKRLCSGNEWADYYHEYWKNPDSILNAKYPQRHDYGAPFLKLTFQKKDRSLTEELYEALDQQHNTRVGYYLRHTGEMTISLAIRKSCNKKAKVAFKVLKTVVSYARRMHLPVDDATHILTTKYFLYYFFGGRELFIKPVLHESKCVICTKGRNSRITELKKLLTTGSEDEKHEVEAMITYLEDDHINDTTITISGSTVVYKRKGEATSEFDGICIYPNRDQNQVVLFEAKNTDEKPSYGKKCLNKKLKNLGLEYEYKDIIVYDHDAYYKMTV